MPTHAEYKADFERRLKIISDLTKNEKYSHIFKNIPVNTSKCAVLIEPRKLNTIEYVLRNFIFHLAPKGWCFQIIHSNSNKEYVDEITKGMNIKLSNLNVDSLTYEEYNKLCLDKKLYEMIDAENILIFQEDCLLVNGDLDEFLEYDYVGAPWPWWNPDFIGKNAVGNGGLSFRKKSCMLKVCDLFKIFPKEINEDLYISQCNFLKFPTPQKASEFSVELIFNPNTKGFHKPWITGENAYIMAIKSFY